MIRIVSYLRDPKSGEFVPVDQVTFAPPNDLHIEGAIELTVNGVAVLDTTLWDDVDQLWAYIATMVETLSHADSAMTYFPDQPIEFAITRTGGRKVRVSARIGDEVRGAVADEDEFLSALRQAGPEFFTTMSRLVPANAPMYRNSIDKLAIP